MLIDVLCKVGEDGRRKCAVRIDDSKGARILPRLHISHCWEIKTIMEFLPRAH